MKSVKKLKIRKIRQNMKTGRRMMDMYGERYQNTKKKGKIIWKVQRNLKKIINKIRNKKTKSMKTGRRRWKFTEKEEAKIQKKGERNNMKKAKKKLNKKG